ncbi:MAG TPA: hypothetical protein VET27_20825 [Mycobacterium sp.]|nr:hypothetical protein [Mycobacterium sp.]
MRASAYCRHHDLADPITVLAATGLRESELLGLLWRDFDADAGILTVTGMLGRAARQGLPRHDTAKSDAGLRTLPPASLRRRRPQGTAPSTLPRRAGDDLPVHGGDAASP